MMTVGDYPEYLAVGYLANQNMLLPDDEIVEVEQEGRGREIGDGCHLLS